MCWVLSLAELSGCWTWGMLFVMVVEGRLWLLGWDGFGSWWRCKGIYGSLAGTLNTDWSVGTRGGMTKMTIMVVASEMCG
jgi:hypothetical protein